MCFINLNWINCINFLLSLFVISHFLDSLITLAQWFSCMFFGIVAHLLLLSSTRQYCHQSVLPNSLEYRICLQLKYLFMLIVSISKININTKVLVIADKILIKQEYWVMVQMNSLLNP